MTIVADSTGLIGFARIDELKLVQGGLQKIFIPEAVYREVTERNRPGAKEIDNAVWIETVSVENAEFVKELSDIIDPGEAEAVALALQMNADHLYTDDSDARREAEQRNINVFGSLSVLRIAKENKLIERASPFADRMMKQGFYLSSKLYSDWRKSLGE